jgi:hypothetical protein
MSAWIKANPAWFMATIEALVAAVLNLLLVFAVHVTPDQAAAINAVALIVVALALGLWAQQPIQRLVDEAKASGVREGLVAKHD